MRRVFYLLLIGILSLPFAVIAQEEQEKLDEPANILDEPANIGDETFDTFKSSAFKLYTMSMELKAKVDNKEPFSIDDITVVENMALELATLLKQSPNLLPAVKKLRPFKKIKLGLKSIKSSIKAVKYGIQNVTYVVDNMIRVDDGDK